MANEEISRTGEARDGSVEPITTPANEISTADKPALVPSPTQQSSNNSDLWAQIQPHLARVLEHIREHREHIDLVPKLLFTLWNLSLLVGGLIFVVYFGSIGFMPETDVPASVTLLTVSAITGAFLLIVTSFILVAPSYIWRRWTIRHETLKSLWSDRAGEFSRWRATLWFGLPLVSFLVGVPLLLVVDEQYHACLIWGSLLSGPSIALIAALIFLWKQSQKWPALGNLGLSVFSSAFAFSPVILLVSVFIGASPALHADTIGGPQQILLLVLTLIYILVFNAALVSSRQSSAIEYILLAAFITILILVMLQNITYIPKRVMNAYQFGYIPASLVITDVGCMIVDNHNIPTLPNKNTCQVSNVTIHSRLGSTYYVQVNGTDNTPVCLTIPSEHVLSWAISKPKKGVVWPSKLCF